MRLIKKPCKKHTHTLNQSLETMSQFSEITDKRIALLLSGGVDSAVVLHILCQEGLKPDCFYIKIGPADTPEKEWNCTSEEDLEMATALCRKYGCHLEVVDCHREYWDRVTTYTMQKVRRGFTPNPDVMCNRLIKFGAFHEKRGKDYDLIATGHYATTEYDCEGRKWLCTSPDPVKDQTDFLAQIFDWQLKKALFPIGAMKKEEVRRIAEENRLVNAKRKDSQGICFLGKINYNDYLRQFLGEREGKAIELETGKVIGKHKGHWFCTIGQRKGLGFGGGPWFVVKKDVKKNIIYLSHGYDPEDAYSSEFIIHDINWLTVNPFSGEEQRGRASDVPKNVSNECSSENVSNECSSEIVSDSKSLENVSATHLDITFKIRHTADYNHAVLTWLEDGRFMVRSEKPIHGVAPGQFCVIYDSSHHRCYGSGEITL